MNSKVTLAAVLGAFALLSLWSARRESAGYDEVPHIGGGYSHFALGDHRHDLGGEPPLPKLLAGAAIATLAPPFPTDDAAWRGCNPEATCRLSTRFLYGEGDGNAIVLRARLPFILLGVVLGAVVAAWTRELFGGGAALAAVVLYGLNPELLAHSHYVGSDLAITLVSTLLLWGLWRLCERPTVAHGLWVASAAALAVITKFSFPALGLMGATLLAVAVRAGGRALPRPFPLRVLVATALAAMVLGYGAIWAIYRFRAAEAASPELGCDMTIETLLPQPTLARRVLQAARDGRYLPEAYATGLALRVNESDGRRLSFIAGEVRAGRTWSYFPIALAVKTPIPLLALAAAGVVLGIRGGDRRRVVLAIALPAAAYLALAMSARFNVGYRHLQPMLPLLCILGGAGAAAIAARPRGRLGVALLLAWQGAGTMNVAPHFLSYFNELAGGPAGGSRILADSNVDWGQDLAELTRVCRERGFDRIKLSYFGNASPDAALVPYAGALPSVTSCWRPRAWATSIEAGDVVAVSVTNLRLVYISDHSAYALRVELPGTSGTMGFGHMVRYLEARYRPAAWAGYSIVVYHLTPEYER